MKSYLLAFLTIIAACTATERRGELTPEQTVETFVRLSSDVRSAADRSKLATLCEGRMRKAFDGLTDDAFAISYVNQPLRIKGLRVIESNVDGNLARVHYQVQIENPHGQDPTEEISEREVELLRVGGRWYLEAIRPKGSDQIAFTRGMIF